MAQTTVSLTSTQLLTLNSQPVTLVAASSGNLILPYTAAITMTFETCGFGPPPNPNPGPTIPSAVVMIALSATFGLPFTTLTNLQSTISVASLPLLPSALVNENAGIDMPIAIAAEPLILTSAFDFAPWGGLAAGTISAPGTGYAVGDTVGGGNWLNGELTVTSVGTGGAVEGITIASPGQGLLVGEIIVPTSTSGKGSGLEITVTTLHVPDCTASVTINYDLIPLS